MNLQFSEADYIVWGAKYHSSGFSTSTRNPEKHTRDRPVCTVKYLQLNRYTLAYQLPSSQQGQNSAG